MNKKRATSLILNSLIISSLIFFSGCSDTQNLKKKTSKVTDKSMNAISLKFTGQSTTENGITVDEIEKGPLTKYTKILSNIFAKGSRDQSLFSEPLFENAKPVFTPPKNATDEKVDVTLNVLKSDVKEENLAVATIVQSKVEAGTKLSRTGTIYLNSDGLITGYKLTKFVDAGSPS